MVIQQYVFAVFFDKVFSDLGSKPALAIKPIEYYRNIHRNGGIDRKLKI
ncbi:hypothetical protein [Candidatus Nitrosocosmicus hydrocola]|nr:hypothetical protein [Candidatus Nitrosocosmicus hydrocola]